MTQKMTKKTWYDTHYNELEPKTAERFLKVLDDDEIVKFTRMYNSYIYKKKQAILAGKVSRTGLVETIINKIIIKRK